MEYKRVGSMYIETEGGVVEVGFIETPNLGVIPAGARDAITGEEPTVFPSTEQVFEAIELAKWCYLNSVVFTECKTSNVTLAEWANEPLEDDQ